MAFGEYIKGKREERGYTQRKLALAAGLGNSTISRIEGEGRIPDIATLTKLAKALRLPMEDLAQAAGFAMPEESPKKKGVQIPVLGEIAAGIPLDAIEEVIDYEEIPASMAKTGDFLGLRIKGDSMSPHILDGDTVIIRQQADIESGEKSGEARGRHPLDHIQRSGVSTALLLKCRGKKAPHHDHRESGRAAEKILGGPYEKTFCTSTHSYFFAGVLYRAQA